MSKIWLDSITCENTEWILFYKKHYVQSNWKDNTVISPTEIYLIEFGNTLKET